MPTTTISEDIHTVRIDLAERAYDVVVGEGILDSVGERIVALGDLGKICVVVTDSTVGPIYGDRVMASLKGAGFSPTMITVPSGEISKSMGEVARVSREMLRAGLSRKSFVVALGGGVVGDLTGFCAAIVNRGIPFIQIPTTVVSQVDSSVGGKTGVNAPEGKNLIGAFHQPKFVLIDSDTLQTLGDREYREGFAEVIKHAAIRDADMLEMIANQGVDRSGLSPLIARNVAIKGAVVEEDERETSGVRALLNFGHTIGHAIEGAAGYGRLLHGEAVSIGMVPALRLSERIAGLDSAAAKRINSLLTQFRLPKYVSADFEVTTILDLMKRDKKFLDGKINFVLLRAAGDAFVSGDVTEADIQAEVERLIVV